MRATVAWLYTYLLAAVFMAVFFDVLLVPILGFDSCCSCREGCGNAAAYGEHCRCMIDGQWWIRFAVDGGFADGI